MKPVTAAVLLLAAALLFLGGCIPPESVGAKITRECKSVVRARFESSHPFSGKPWDRDWGATAVLEGGKDREFLDRYARQIQQCITNRTYAFERGRPAR